MSSQTNIALVPLKGDLDVRSVPRVRNVVTQLIAGGCRRIVLSMAAVDYVDSAGMGLLLGLVSRMRDVRGLLSITDVSSRLMRVFKRYRLVDYAPVSRAGDRPVVQELDPSVRPLSCNVLRVDPDNLCGARGRVNELLSRMDFSNDALFDMTLAVGEALGNAVDHTCNGGVLATVTIYPDRAVVEVSDCGCGYELKSDEDPETTLDPIERGRGIKLMRLLADSVTIGLKPSGKGTVVRLVKLTHPQQAGGEATTAQQEDGATGKTCVAEPAVEAAG